MCRNPVDLDSIYPKSSVGGQQTLLLGTSNASFRVVGDLFFSLSTWERVEVVLRALGGGGKTTG